MNKEELLVALSEVLDAGEIGVRDPVYHRKPYEDDFQTIYYLISEVVSEEQITEAYLAINDFDDE